MTLSLGTEGSLDCLRWAVLVWVTTMESYHIRRSPSSRNYLTNLRKLRIYRRAWGENDIQMDHGWCVDGRQFWKNLKGHRGVALLIRIVFVSSMEQNSTGWWETNACGIWMKQFCNCLTNWVGPEWINCNYRTPVISSTFLTEIFINIHGLFMLRGAPGGHTQIFQKKAMRHKFSFLSLDWRVMLDKSETWALEDWEQKCLRIFCPIQSGS